MHRDRDGKYFRAIEKKWQKFWYENKVFKADDDSPKTKFYVLDMFPYPSGAGLHVGHPLGYTATDIVARYKWMKGYNVLHPMGWDAFGLPAEQYALETGVHPEKVTRRNIETFRRQILSLGLAYDWDREIATCDPDYYKWTQWIFLQMFKQGLAYQAETMVNYCPALGTVLADEEIVDGRSERGGHEVVRVPMRQWMLRITAYADRLLEDLDLLDWPEPIKQMQRTWIGRSEGADIDFPLEGSRERLTVFTTRPDTIYGVMFMVLAPEHPLVEVVTSADKKEEVSRYVKAALQKNEVERSAMAREKTGVFTGGYAVNPFSGRRIPIYVADYVLMTYGTGAIMAVPAHDARDFEFAQKHGLDVVEVVSPDGQLHAPLTEAFEGEGVAVNSGPYDGLTTAEFKKRVVMELERKGLGKRMVRYKLRDWVFSRQRYWGEPFPLIHLDDGTVVPVAEDELPVTLPEVESYRPAGQGQSPLAAIEDWVLYREPKTGKVIGRRETHTMPQWAGSCWYYLRYLDPKNEEQLVSPEKEKKWMPVDLYVGGAEHAVLHLLYARFWHKFLYDIGVVSTPEPFMKLVNQGLILGEDGQKMSKSRGNVINPDVIVEEYGADALRVYEMFMGPLEAVKPWSTQGIKGVRRFLDRVYRLFTGGASDVPPSLPLKKALHRAIRKVTDDIERMRFNTAVAELMTLVNEIYKADERPREVLEGLCLLLSPFAPHLCEEGWELLGHEAPMIRKAAWPEYDPELIEEEEVEIVIQVNGRLRGSMTAPRDMEDQEVERLAMAQPNVRRHLEGKKILRTIVVKDRLVNFVAR